MAAVALAVTLRRRRFRDNKEVAKAVGLETTVAQLKATIRDEYPGNPPVDGQRLVYAGLLLPDDATLDVVRKLGADKETKEIVIHLIVKEERGKLAPAYAPYAPDPPTQPPSDPFSVLACRPQQAVVADLRHTSPQTVNHAILNVTLRNSTAGERTVVVPVAHVALVGWTALEPIAELCVGRLRRRCVAGQAPELIPCFGSGRLTLELALAPPSLDGETSGLVVRLRFTSDNTLRSNGTPAASLSSWRANPVQYDVATVGAGATAQVWRVPETNDPTNKSFVVRKGNNGSHAFFWIKERAGGDAALSTIQATLEDRCHEQTAACGSRPRSAKEPAAITSVSDLKRLLRDYGSDGGSAS